MQIVTSIGGELWHAQAQNGVNFDFGVQFDLEGQGQSPPKTIGILTNVFYTYCSNLVILAWTGVELSRGQASAYRTQTDGRTHRQTDAGNDNTRRPKLASGQKHKDLIRLQYAPLHPITQHAQGSRGWGKDRCIDTIAQQKLNLIQWQIRVITAAILWHEFVISDYINIFAK